jgi:hypothetical protein
VGLVEVRLREPVLFGDLAALVASLLRADGGGAGSASEAEAVPTATAGRSRRRSSCICAGETELRVRRQVKGHVTRAGVLLTTAATAARPFATRSLLRHALVPVHFLLLLLLLLLHLLSHGAGVSLTTQARNNPAYVVLSPLEIDVSHLSTFLCFLLCGLAFPFLIRHPGLQTGVPPARACLPRTISFCGKLARAKYLPSFSDGFRQAEQEDGPPKTCRWSPVAAAPSRPRQNMSHVSSREVHACLNLPEERRLHVTFQRS